MIWCSDAIGQRHILDAKGRVGSVDNGFFIHATHPRHVETVVLLSNGSVTVVSMSEDIGGLNGSLGCL